MKKIGLLIIVGIIFHSNAFATKARMTSLGQDADRGSFYLDDNRGVFLNPSRIANTDSYLVIESGDTSLATNTPPEAEGGFFYQGETLAYGIYLGNDVNSQNTQRRGTGYAGATISTFTTDLVDREDELDVFLGGNMGFKWGTRITYASGKNESGGIERSQKFLGVGIGVQMKQLSLYTNLDISDKSQGADLREDKWEGFLGINAGASYNLYNWTLFADFQKKGGEVIDTGIKYKTERTVMQVGAGYQKELIKNARLNMDVSYFQQEDKDTAATVTKIVYNQIPVVLGVEADAFDWLILRGSIKQNAILDTVKTESATGKTEVDSASTAVSVGITMNFDTLKLDGTLTGTDGGEDNLHLDNLASNVAIRYGF